MNKQKFPKQLTLRSRTFSQEELLLICRLVKKHFDKGRTCISMVICEELEWRQPNGWLKDRACRDVLRRLEEKGIVQLPPSMVKRERKAGGRNNSKKTRNLELILSPVTGYPKSLDFELAKGDRAELLWNSLVDTYHYLGHKVSVGRCLKYLIRADGVLVGAISFSSASWHLASRNKLLEKFMDLTQIRDLVINNSRFLILPNVVVPNLASTVLSLATKKVVVDWTNYYSITPQIVETFVDSEKFLGTCYRAANWLEIGETKGYAKKGASFHNSQTSKQIFLYGLSKSVRKKLLNATKRERLNHV
ncbi:MAG: DUF4338 domain-containing protein [Anaerolineae bacterium]|nr:DUF4338 domain-containing protein [Anaerolineae bacterium]